MSSAKEELWKFDLRYLLMYTHKNTAKTMTRGVQSSGFRDGKTMEFPIGNVFRYQ